MQMDFDKEKVFCIPKMLATSASTSGHKFYLINRYLISEEDISTSSLGNCSEEGLSIGSTLSFLPLASALGLLGLSRPLYCRLFGLVAAAAAAAESIASAEARKCGHVSLSFFSNCCCLRRCGCNMFYSTP